MVEITNERKGWIGLVTALAVLGGSIYLLPTEAENAYYCPLTDDFAVFHRLSSSGKTGYYMDGDTEISFACREGRLYKEWVPLRQYIEEQGLSWEDVIKPECPMEGKFIKVRGEQGEYICVYNNEGVLETYSKCYRNDVFKAYAGELICPS